MVLLVLPRRIFRLWGVDHELADLGSTDTQVPRSWKHVSKAECAKHHSAGGDTSSAIAMLAQLWIGSSIAKKSRARSNPSVIRLLSPPRALQ